MAIQKRIKTNSGITLPYAYTKIKNIMVHGEATAAKDPGQLIATGNWVTYADKDARQAEAAAIASGSFSFAVDVSKNWLPQAYDELKKQPGFEDSQDC